MPATGPSSTGSDAPGAAFAPGPTAIIHHETDAEMRRDLVTHPPGGAVAFQDFSWMPQWPGGSWTDLDWLTVREDQVSEPTRPAQRPHAQAQRHRESPPPQREPTDKQRQATLMVVRSDRKPERVLPAMTPEDRRIVLTDTSGHLHHVSAQALALMAAYFAERNQGQTAARFVDAATLHSFVELFFENFADFFAVVHISTLSQDDVHWILLLAAAAVGAQYSSLRHASLFSGVLQDLLCRAVEEHCPEFPPAVDPTWTQIILLRDICLYFNGGKTLQMARQTQKHRLITFCQTLLASTAADTFGPARDSQLRGWDEWRAAETRLRLLYGVYFLESLQFIFNGLRPGLQLDDFTDALPCHESLWRCRAAAEWEALLIARPGLTATPRRPTLREDWAGDMDISACHARLLSVHIYAEERLALGRLSSLSLLGPSPSRASPTPPDQQETDEASLRSLIKATRARAQEKLQRLSLRSSSEPVPLLVASSHDILSPLLLLLRDVSARCLLALSGWQADERQAGQARQELSSWMSREPRHARQGLSRAAWIFSSLRQKRMFAPYDPLALLTAGLYIWAYDQLATTVHRDEHRDEHRDAQKNDGALGPLTVRLDRPADVGNVERWVQAGGRQAVYITGVGILDGESSQQRILQEVRRVLLTRTEWSTMSRSIAGGFTCMIEHRRPQFAEDCTPETAEEPAMRLFDGPHETESAMN